MSKSALLDWIPESRRALIYAEEDGKTYLETRQDVAPIIEAAKAMWCDNPPKDFRRVALIPEAVLNQSYIEGWFGDAAAWRKWANDPANRDFRTTKGTI
jgi:hypothetical protein